MKINNVQHIAVNTGQIEKAVDFYTGIMGFEEESRADMGECTLVYLKISDGAYMELFDNRGNTEDAESFDTRRGLRHIAFDVDEVSEWNKYLKNKGVKFVQDVTEMPEIGKRALLIEDPDGVVIELCEDL